MTIRVGVCGAAGRMGAAACRAIASADHLQLAAAVARRTAGDAAAAAEGVTIADDVAAFAASDCDVVVDFTTAEAARANLPAIAAAGIHVVVGTTGLQPADIETLAASAASAGANVVVAANFAISAVLMMRLCELAAPYFDTVEIIEMHHDAKPDAPSGTALATAERIAAASSQWAADPTTDERLAGARGAIADAGVRIHSVRMRGMVAHQEVIFGAGGQTLTVRQDSYDRNSFMPGVVLACRRIGELPGLTVGLDRVLGLDGSVSRAP